MEKPVKAKQILLNVAPFIPLIVFQVWTSSYHAPGNMVIAAFSMLAFCILIIVIAYRWDKPGYFDWAIAGYFTAISGSLLLWPDGTATLLSHYGVTGIYVCLFTAASCPPLLGMDPFTYHYAKKTAPPDFWNNPLFIKINRIMTLTWTGIFALCIVLTLYPSFLMQIVLPNVLVLGFGFPFNSLFPDFYLKRLGHPLPIRVETYGSGKRWRRRPQLPERHKRLDSSRKRDYKSTFYCWKGENDESTCLKFKPPKRRAKQNRTDAEHPVKGMREAGADVEVVHLRRKKVNNCIGCFTCWTKTPGICLHKDDMTNELFPKWAGSDLVIYASPLIPLHGKCGDEGLHRAHAASP